MEETEVRKEVELCFDKRVVTFSHTHPLDQLSFS